MLLDTTRQCDLLANLSTSWRGELDLGKISLNAQDTTTCRGRSNVDEQKLIFREFRDLCLFFVFCSDTEQSAE